MHDPTTVGQSEPAQSFLLLVIDDDLIQRTIIAKLGTQAGFDVTAAATFDEAAGLLTKHKFDCVTLDLSLGEQSGILLLRSIVDSGHRMPVIVISGAEPHVLQSTVAMAQSLNLDSLPLSKPLNLTELRGALAKKRQSAPALRLIMQLAESAPQIVSA
jgi:DNA-binding NtrC family response regulator